VLCAHALEGSFGVNEERSVVMWASWLSARDVLHALCLSQGFLLPGWTTGCVCVCVGLDWLLNGQWRLHGRCQLTTDRQTDRQTDRGHHSRSGPHDVQLAHLVGCEDPRAIMVRDCVVVPHSLPLSRCACAKKPSTHLHTNTHNLTTRDRPTSSPHHPTNPAPGLPTRTDSFKTTRSP